MNRGNQNKPIYETGEVRIGVQSPGDGWLKLDGSTLSGTALGKKLSKFGYFSWVTQVSNLGAVNINDIAYGNGVWVLGSSGGDVRSSTDGATWTTRTSNFGVTSIQSVAHNGLTGASSTFVAVGLAGTLRTSTDATTWTTRTSQFGTTDIGLIAYGNGLWVAAGTAGTLRTSTDAITWTTRVSNFGTTSIQGIAYGNGIWVAVGSAAIRTSTDATTWVTQTSYTPSTASFNGIRFNNGNFLATTDVVYKSSDGVTWTSKDTGLNGTFIQNIVYGNGIWYALASSGLSRVSVDNGETWSARNTISTGLFTAAWYNDGKFAIGASTILKTADVNSAVVLPTLNFGYNVWGWIYSE